ncbi:unnamed protein product [Closterium sp. NIES-65]|nr:unnamed protein product [Closterium sp. NIES-65]
MYKPRVKAHKSKNLHHSDGARGWPPEESAASAATHSSGEWSGTAEALSAGEAVGGMAAGGMGAGGMPVSSPDILGKGCFSWRGVFHKDHGARLLKLEGGGVAEVLVVDPGRRDDEVRTHHGYAMAGFSGGGEHAGMTGAHGQGEDVGGYERGSDRVGGRGESMAGAEREQERALGVEERGCVCIVSSAAAVVGSGETHDLSVRTDDTVSSDVATVGSVSSARLNADGVSSSRAAAADGAGAWEAASGSARERDTTSASREIPHEGGVGEGGRGEAARGRVESDSLANGDVAAGSTGAVTGISGYSPLTTAAPTQVLPVPVDPSLTCPPYPPSLSTHPDATASSPSALASALTSPPLNLSSPPLSAAPPTDATPLGPLPTITPSATAPSLPSLSAPQPSAPPPRPHTAAASSLPRPPHALPPTPASREGGHQRGARGGVSREGRGGTAGTGSGRSGVSSGGRWSGGGGGGGGAGFHARKLSTDDSFLGLSSRSPLDTSACTARTPRLSPHPPAAAATAAATATAATADTATSPSIIHKSPSTPSVSTDDELAPLPGLGIAGAGARAGMEGGMVGGGAAERGALGEGEGMGGGAGMGQYGGAYIPRIESVGSSSGSVVAGDGLVGVPRPSTLKTWKSMHSHRHKLARGLLFAGGESGEEGGMSPRGLAFMAGARRRGLWRRTVTPKESVKRLLMWPQAGSQVSRCAPGDSSAENSWSPVDPASFDVRGETFLSDRRKVPACPPAIYEPWGVDVFHTPLKIRHVAEHVELPASLFGRGGGGESGEVQQEGVEGGEMGQGEADGCMDGVCAEVYGMGEEGESGDEGEGGGEGEWGEGWVLPEVLVVNLQVPLYTTLPLLQQEQDGEGISLVLYLNLSPAYARGVPPCLAAMLEPLCQPPAPTFSPQPGMGSSMQVPAATEESTPDCTAAVAAVAGPGVGYSAADASHSRSGSKGSGMGGSSSGRGGKAVGGSEAGRKESPNAFKWDRPKLLARVVNEAGMGLGSGTKKTVQSWSGQPILTRSHHSLIRGESKPYVEMDIDVHRFPNQVKRGLLPLRRHLSSCVFDIAIILQAQYGGEAGEEGERSDDDWRNSEFGFSGLATIADVVDELDGEWMDDTSAGGIEAEHPTHSPLALPTASETRMPGGSSSSIRFHNRPRRGTAKARRWQSFSPSPCVCPPLSASFRPIFFRNLRLPAYSVISTPPSSFPPSPAPSYLSATSSATSVPILRHRSADSPSPSSSCSTSTCASPTSSAGHPPDAGMPPLPRQVDWRKFDSPWRAMLFRICGFQSAVLQRRQHVFVMRHAERLDAVDPRWAQREPTSRPWDPPLSEWGRYQAYQVGVRLRREGWGVTRVVCAPYVRCAETAAELIAAMSSTPDMDYAPSGPGYGRSSSPCLPLPRVGRGGAEGCRTVGVQRHILRAMQVLRSGQPLTPVQALQHRKRKHARDVAGSLSGSYHDPADRKAQEAASASDMWQAGMPVPLPLIHACIDYSLCEVIPPGTARPRLSHALAGRAALEALLPAECVERVGWTVTGGADLRVPRGPEEVERAAMRLVTAIDRIAEQLRMDLKRDVAVTHKILLCVHDQAPVFSVKPIVAATIAGGATFSLLSLNASLLHALSSLISVACYPIASLLPSPPPSPSPTTPEIAPSATPTSENGSFFAYTKQAAPAALATMAVTFPNAMQEDTFIHALALELANLGFKRDNCIALVNTCRDEVCRPIVKLIDREFGLSFNIAGLGGLVNCGTTGFKAAMSHLPEFPCEVNDDQVRERSAMPSTFLDHVATLLYLPLLTSLALLPDVFFGFPHVSVGESGQVGSLLRRGRGKPSSACGALIAIKNDISKGGLVEDDADDKEYVLLKKKIAARVHSFGSDGPSLVRVTKAALAAITEDIERLVKRTVNPETADYAVITGVQIHSGYQIPGEPFQLERTCDYIAPSAMYAVVRGTKHVLHCEVDQIRDITSLPARHMID